MLTCCNFASLCKVALWIGARKLKLTLLNPLQLFGEVVYPMLAIQVNTHLGHDWYSGVRLSVVELIHLRSLNVLPVIERDIWSYLSLGSVSFVLYRGIYYTIPHYYSLFEKLVAALTVTGECGVETIAKKWNILPLT